MGSVSHCLGLKVVGRHNKHLLTHRYTHTHTHVHTHTYTPWLVCRTLQPMPPCTPASERTNNKHSGGSTRIRRMRVDVYVHSQSWAGIYYRPCLLVSCVRWQPNACRPLPMPYCLVETTLQPHVTAASLRCRAQWISASHWRRAGTAGVRGVACEV